VYQIPAGDGGGKYEVAGINDRYHPAEVDLLVALIRAGKQQEAEGRAVEFIGGYTDAVVGWHADAAPSISCATRVSTEVRAAPRACSSSPRRRR